MQLLIHHKTSFTSRVKEEALGKDPLADLGMFSFYNGLRCLIGPDSIRVKKKTTWRKAWDIYYSILWIISEKLEEADLVKYKGLSNNQSCPGLKRLPREEGTGTALCLCLCSGKRVAWPKQGVPDRILDSEPKLEGSNTWRIPSLVHMRC